MSEQIKLLTEFLHPAYSEADRRQLIFLAVLHGITTVIFLVSLTAQMLSKHSKKSFWLMRLDSYNGRRVLAINAFTIWLPLCSLYTGAQFACIIFRLWNLDPYADQSSRLVLGVLPLIPLVCCGWMISTSILFSGLAVYHTSHLGSNSGFQIHMPNAYVYHLLLFGVPLALFSVLTTLTVIGNIHFNRAIILGHRFLNSMETGPLDFQAALRFADEAGKAQKMSKAVGYVAAIDATSMFFLFQPAAIIMILAMRRSLKFRRHAQTTNETVPVMSSMLKVLVIYSIYTGIWIFCTMALQWSMIIASNVGNISPSFLEKIQLRIMMWLHGFGTLISAIVLAVVPLFRLRKKANAASDKQTSSYASSGRKFAEPVKLSVLAISRDGMKSDDNIAEEETKSITFPRAPENSFASAV